MTFRSPNDPYRDRKKYHMAYKFGSHGQTSALCFKTIRAINLKYALWTVVRNRVTCKKCLRELR